MIARNDIREVENELFLIQRERAISEQGLSLENIFNHFSLATMMGAKFYHECMIQNIPCLLEVRTKFGRVDSIVEIENQFIIVEFKTFQSQLFLNDTKIQINRYLRHNCPVILIQEKSCFTKFLIDLKEFKFLNKTYIYTLDKFEIY